MKRTYETKVVTVIFKNGETGTFENCLNIYEMEGEVAMIAKGYVESEDLD